MTVNVSYKKNKKTDKLYMKRFFFLRFSIEKMMKLQLIGDTIQKQTGYLWIWFPNLTQAVVLKLNAY